MTDWRTIRIPEDAFERHNELREGLGLTWEQYIGGQVPERRVPEDVLDSVVDYDRVSEIVREEVRDALRDITR